MENDTNVSDLDLNIEVFNSIVTALRKLDVEAQKNILQAVTTILGISSTIPYAKSNEGFLNDTPSRQSVSFLENRSMSPKEFLRDKTPVTDVERIACLAYYLSHYRDTPHFKTIDLSTLNTEAAQPKLSNATVAVDHASRAGLLVQAGGGKKQISAAGELYVQALPNRETARASISNMRPKKRSKKTSTKNGDSNKA